MTVRVVVVLVVLRHEGDTFLVSVLPVLGCCGSGASDADSISVHKADRATHWRGTQRDAQGDKRGAEGTCKAASLTDGEDEARRGYCRQRHCPNCELEAARSVGGRGHLPLALASTGTFMQV